MSVRALTGRLCARRGRRQRRGALPCSDRTVSVYHAVRVRRSRSQARRGTGSPEGASRWAVRAYSSRAVSSCLAPHDSGRCRSCLRYEPTRAQSALATAWGTCRPTHRRGRHNVLERKATAIKECVHSTGNGISARQASFFVGSKRASLARATSRTGGIGRISHALAL